jgi:hypothetical protein
VDCLALGHLGQDLQGHDGLAQPDAAGDGVARCFALAAVGQPLLDPLDHRKPQIGAGLGRVLLSSIEIRREPRCWRGRPALLLGHGQHGAGPGAQMAVTLGLGGVVPDFLGR